MSVSILPVAPEALHDTWPWVRDGLLEVIKRGKERWIPEDVYAALRNATAHLYLVQRNAEEMGFLVLQKLAGLDGTTLFVWAGWCEPRAFIEARQEVLAALDDLARAVGAKRIRHHSTRDGWEWAGNFRLAHKVYEREV